MNFKYKDDFAVFILSHGRAKTMTTVNMLKQGKYSGKWYVVIDDMDDQMEQYKTLYGKHVIVFDKRKESERADLGDNGTDLRIGVLARNFIIDEADRRGYKYHLQLDDDYSAFMFRYVKDDKLKSAKVKNLDKLFSLFIEYLSKTNITCLACSVAGDFLGGAQNKRYYEGLLRKCMNTFFLRSDDKFYFKMRMNDDVSTNVMNTMKGKIFLSCTYCMIEMQETQKGKGGMTETYLDAGTYWKSFYSLMCEPSCCGIQMMNSKHKRIHHKIMWNNCAPKIISEKYKK